MNSRSNKEPRISLFTELLFCRNSWRIIILSCLEKTQLCRKMFVDIHSRQIVMVCVYLLIPARKTTQHNGSLLGVALMMHSIASPTYEAIDMHSLDDDDRQSEELTTQRQQPGCRLNGGASSRRGAKLCQSGIKMQRSNCRQMVVTEAFHMLILVCLK